MPSAVQAKIMELLNGQRLGVLGSSRHGAPYTSLVAFAVEDDGRSILFATGRATRKYANLRHDRQVAFLVDNRSNRARDLVEARAVTAYGQAEEIGLEERSRIVAVMVARHRSLQDFVTSPSSALFRIRVESYHLVQHFQQVTEFRFEP